LPTKVVSPRSTHGYISQQAAARFGLPAI
jgi:hypothetical protein